MTVSCLAGRKYKGVCVAFNRGGGVIVKCEQIDIGYGWWRRMKPPELKAFAVEQVGGYDSA